MKDVGMKQLNLEKELYVHYHKQNFIKYREKLKTSIEDLVGEINSIYNQDTQYFKHQLEMLKKVNTKDNKTLMDIIGLINDINNGAMNKTVESKIMRDLPIKIKQGLSETFAISKQIKNASIQQQINMLDKYLSNINLIIDEIQKNDEDYITYLLNEYKGQKNAINNINLLFKNGNQLNLLAINKTALTSYQSLKTRVELLEKERDALKAGVAKGKILYKDKMIDYSSFIYATHFLFTNILGGIGEGVGASVALRGLVDFIKTINIPNVKVTMEGVGTSKIDRRSTSKSDYTININSQTGEINLSFGISAKAQFSKNNKKIKTTFETSKVKKFLANINKEIQYLFYNSIYHNTKDSLSVYVRRYIAARTMRNSVAGVDQGENVLFVQYLDRIIGIDELFDNFLKADINKKPTISLKETGKIRTSSDFVEKRGSKLSNLLKQEGYSDLNQEDKNIVAYVRSRQVIAKINDLSAQINWEH